MAICLVTHEWRIENGGKALNFVESGSFFIAYFYVIYFKSEIFN